jgi:gliding motility-associated-like protein
MSSSNSTTETIGYSIEDIYDAVMIPNVFSPNGDQINDVMTIKGIRNCERAVIRIFNRWGNEVFYSISPMDEPWDGLFNSEEIIEGSYFYVLELDNFQIKGVVNLFR